MIDLIKSIEILKSIAYPKLLKQLAKCFGMCIVRVTKEKVYRDILKTNLLTRLIFRSFIPYPFYEIISQSVLIQAELKTLPYKS